MKGSPRITFDGVWKKFHRGELHDSLRDLFPALVRGMLGRNPPDAELGTGDFWALRDLSFEVLPGQTLGIIGPNGSGKSTTLKILTRIMEPSLGRCHVHGRVGTLIEVSAGFHGDLTGRENVFLQGAIMGMRSSDIARKFDEIVAFSGVSESIDTPVKRYSSGMNARLGFSIAAHLDPDVLIIDEVLAVGDLEFQERAFGRIRDLARSGIPVVIVSHQLERISELCTDAILLDRGEVRARGTPAETIGAYVRGHDAGRMVSSTGVVELDLMRLTSGPTVRSGERCTVHIEGRIADGLASSVEPLHLRVRSLATGSVHYHTASRLLGLSLSPGAFVVEVELQANLSPGSYMIELSARDLLSQQTIATAASVVLVVSDPGTFGGPTQLNASMRTLL